MGILGIIGISIIVACLFGCVFFLLGLMIYMIYKCAIEKEYKTSVFIFTVILLVAAFSLVISDIIKRSW